MSSFVPFLIDEPVFFTSNSSLEPLNQVELPEKGGKITKLLVVHPILTQEEQDLQSNIIKAIGYNWSNTQSIALSPKDTVKFTFLQEKLGFEKIISFGIPPQQLCLNIIGPYYQPLRVKEVDILFAEKLMELNQKDKKKHLWHSLKQMFGL